MEPTNSPNRTVVATEKHISTSFAEEEIILNLESDTYHGLNEVGTYIWQLIQDPTTVDEVIEEVYDEYPIDRERCETDVRMFLSHLTDKGLIKTNATDS